VIEILSPSTELLDRGRKLDLYAFSGVKEVWLVTPYPALIEIFVLDNGQPVLRSPVFRDEAGSSTAEVPPKCIPWRCGGGGPAFVPHARAYAST
jgi:Uma2 family endonuclease